MRRLVQPVTATDRAPKGPRISHGHAHALVRSPPAPTYLPTFCLSFGGKFVWWIRLPPSKQTVLHQFCSASRDGRTRIGRGRMNDIYAYSAEGRQSTKQRRVKLLSEVDDVRWHWNTLCSFNDNG